MSSLDAKLVGAQNAYDKSNRSCCKCLKSSSTSCIYCCWNDRITNCDGHNADFVIKSNQEQSDSQSKQWINFQNEYLSRSQPFFTLQKVYLGNSNCRKEQAGEITFCCNQNLSQKEKLAKVCQGRDIIMVLSPKCLSRINERKVIANENPGLKKLFLQHFKEKKRNENPRNKNPFEVLFQHLRENVFTHNAIDPFPCNESCMKHKRNIQKTRSAPLQCRIVQSEIINRQLKEPEPKYEENSTKTNEQENPPLPLWSSKIDALKTETKQKRLVRHKQDVVNCGIRQLIAKKEQKKQTLNPNDDSENQTSDQLAVLQQIVAEGDFCLKTSKNHIQSGVLGREPRYQYRQPYEIKYLNIPKSKKRVESANEQQISLVDNFRRSKYEQFSVSRSPENEVQSLKAGPSKGEPQSSYAKQPATMENVQKRKNYKLFVEKESKNSDLHILNTPASKTQAKLQEVLFESKTKHKAVDQLIPDLLKAEQQRSLIKIKHKRNLLSIPISVTSSKIKTARQDAGQLTLNSKDQQIEKNGLSLEHVDSQPSNLTAIFMKQFLKGSKTKILQEVEDETKSGSAEFKQKEPKSPKQSMKFRRPKYIISFTSVPVVSKHSLNVLHNTNPVSEQYRNKCSNNLNNEYKKSVGAKNFRKKSDSNGFKYKVPTFSPSNMNTRCTFAYNTRIDSYPISEKKRLNKKNIKQKIKLMKQKAKKMIQLIKKEKNDIIELEKNLYPQSSTKDKQLHKNRSASSSDTTLRSIDLQGTSSNEHIKQKKLNNEPVFVKSEIIFELPNSSRKQKGQVLKRPRKLRRSANMAYTTMKLPEKLSGRVGPAVSGHYLLSRNLSVNLLTSGSRVLAPTNKETEINTENSTLASMISSEIFQIRDLDIIEEEDADCKKEGLCFHNSDDSSLFSRQTIDEEKLVLMMKFLDPPKPRKEKQEGRKPSIAEDTTLPSVNSFNKETGAQWMRTLDDNQPDPPLLRQMREQSIANQSRSSVVTTFAFEELGLHQSRHFLADEKPVMNITHQKSSVTEKPAIKKKKNIKRKKART